MTIEQHQQILELVEQGEIDAALDQLDNLDDDDKRSSEAMLTRASIQVQKAEFDNALETLRTVVTDSPDNPVALLMMAGTLLHCDRVNEAKKIYSVIARIGEEPWLSEAQRGLTKIADRGNRSRIAIVCGKGMDTFIRPIQNGLADRFDFRLFTVASLRDVKEAMEWADICWFEWCDEILVRASNQLDKTCAVVCRLHSYEVFEKTPARVNWAFVDEVVFVAEHVREIFNATVDAQVSNTLIHNGVDVSRLKYSDRSPSKDIAFLGFVNHKKNPSLLLQIIAKLVAIDPDFRLHIGGTFQELRYKIYFDHMIRTLGIQDNVVEYGWIEDVDDWLEDKGYIVSCSVFESFGLSIVEGMAKGIKPIVHHWPGAASLYPTEILFGTVDEAVEMIVSDEYRSSAYRSFVEDHYGLTGQLAKVSILLEGLLVEEPEQAVQAA